jgi:hypothetical protein
MIVRKKLCEENQFLRLIFWSTLCGIWVVHLLVNASSDTPVLWRCCWYQKDHPGVKRSCGYRFLSRSYFAEVQYFAGKKKAQSSKAFPKLWSAYYLHEAQSWVLVLLLSSCNWAIIHFEVVSNGPWRPVTSWRNHWRENHESRIMGACAICIQIFCIFCLTI